MNRNGSFVLLCQSDSFFCCFLDSGTFQCGNLNYLTADLFAQFVNIDLIAGFFNDIHHVNRHDHRNTEFQNLCGQIQVTLNVGSVYDINDRIRFFVDQIISGNHFLQCIWRQRINTR